MSDLPGYDFAIQALSGLMSITGPVEGPPCKVGVAVDRRADRPVRGRGGAGLPARPRSAPATATPSTWPCSTAPWPPRSTWSRRYLTSGSVPPRQGNAHLQIVPYQLFATADDWLVAGRRQRRPVAALLPGGRAAGPGRRRALRHQHGAGATTGPSWCRWWSRC